MCPDDLKLSQYKKETLQYKKESDLVIGLERFNFALSHRDKTLCSHVLESAVRTLKEHPALKEAKPNTGCQNNLMPHQSEGLIECKHYTVSLNP